MPLLVTLVAGYGCVASIGFFLYLIDHVGKMLRPSGALTSVASRAHTVIDSVYPRRLKDPREPMTEFSLPQLNAATTVTSSKAGVVLAFDDLGLFALATQYDCVIELAPQVGNFVAPGDPLFRIYGGANVPVRALLNSIALGVERTVEQDPMFAFRDRTSRPGLSPAINDPTTAVLAIDQLIICCATSAAGAG